MLKTISNIAWLRVFLSEICQLLQAMLLCFVDDLSKMPQKQLSVYILLQNLFERLNQLLNSVHILFLGHSNFESCSCSGEKGNCRYSSLQLDANDYFHALKNSHKNVPECSVEPYLLSGYVLPHKPWR